MNVPVGPDAASSAFWASATTASPPPAVDVPVDVPSSWDATVDALVDVLPESLEPQAASATVAQSASTTAAPHLVRRTNEPIIDFSSYSEVSATVRPGRGRRLGPVLDVRAAVTATRPFACGRGRPQAPRR